jgi:hypothetical protein
MDSATKKVVNNKSLFSLLHCYKCFLPRQLLWQTGIQKITTKTLSNFVSMCQYQLSHCDGETMAGSTADLELKCHRFGYRRGQRFVNISMVQDHFTEKSFDRIMFYRMSFDRKYIWPIRRLTKGRLTESSFYRKKSFGRKQKVVWPKIFGKWSFDRKSNLKN